MWSRDRCSRVLSDRLGVRGQAPGSYKYEYEYEKEVRREPSGGGRDDPSGSIAARAASHRRCPGARDGRTPTAAGEYLRGQRQQNALETCARSMWRRRVRSTRGVMEREFSRGPPRWSITSRTGLALRTQRTSCVAAPEGLPGPAQVLARNRYGWREHALVAAPNRTPVGDALPDPVAHLSSGPDAYGALIRFAGARRPGLPRPWRRPGAIDGLNVTPYLIPRRSRRSRRSRRHRRSARPGTAGARHLPHRVHRHHPARDRRQAG
ncbi:conserved hypothetical protein [Streptomyces sviceus ATCC 29083]|uniref:Uncharacterized protein n=1 Tax=Streptomyces sviceus (strain ATCC 29083 / DSM 924 / JCM 4929 / NBRC 13980 / NCIMB 11184 / NRRL 5439 / UC 5370) TaxID=463191 RepID=B5HPN7_STRX2|nr:conserved hypothetical protein [Streptomyces sviceus ATCC 29083]